MLMINRSAFGGNLGESVRQFGLSRQSLCCQTRHPRPTICTLMLVFFGRTVRWSSCSVKGSTFCCKRGHFVVELLLQIR